ncbi:hypothetical protein PoB_006463700 [Plakobranchus ocellatus]|uniref:Uncharacterized protein n=1 Tax=Plakobranchus ocellatus TaxID=259542 RepID=A0AAV4D1V4_9GAST|nr:hypothetical protein PoB_006463700 [Plakobranchus ocellatus]
MLRGERVTSPPRKWSPQSQTLFSNPNWPQTTSVGDRDAGKSLPTQPQWVIDKIFLDQISDSDSQNQRKCLAKFHPRGELHRANEVRTLAD